MVWVFVENVVVIVANVEQKGQIMSSTSMDTTNLSSLDLVFTVTSTGIRESYLVGGGCNKSWWYYC